MTSGPAADSERARDESLVETIADGVVVFDAEGEITFVNETIASFVGRPRDDLVGAELPIFRELSLFSDDDYERLAEAVGTLCAGSERERKLTLETADGEGSVLDIRLSSNVRGGAVTEIVGIIRDVTDRERAFETIDRQRTALQQLYEINARSDLTEDERLQAVLDIGCAYLDLPYGFLTTVDGETQQLVHVVGDSEQLHPGGTVQLEESYCRQTVDSDGLVALRDVPEELGDDNPAYAKFGMSCYIGTKVLVDNDLYGTFCFAADDAREQSFSPTEQQFVKLLGQWSGHVIERKQFENRLHSLNDMAEELLRAESVADVARIGVETGSDLFEVPVTACWSYDAVEDTFRPLVETESSLAVVGETPTLERGKGLVWESFDAGKLRVYEDLAAESGAYDRETPLRSEVHIPLGSNGMLVTGTTEPRGFSPAAIQGLQLLGQLMEAAMLAVKRREAIAERGEAIQRQNQQLEQFARVVAHDLRNPLAGAVGFLEVARETNAQAHFDRVEESLDRMESLIDELLDIARGQRKATDVRELALEPLVREAWSYLDAPGATLTIEGDVGRLNADETRLLQLLGNLFRNSVEHGSTGGRTGSDDGVAVAVGPLPDGDGFYVENDGPSFPAATRAEILQYGRTEAAVGTGVGMMSITDVAEAHGWAFDITEADGGGARFEFRVAGDAQ